MTTIYTKNSGLLKSREYYDFIPSGFSNRGSKIIIYLCKVKGKKGVGVTSRRPVFVVYGIYDVVIFEVSLVIQ